jgi:predicted ATPase
VRLLAQWRELAPAARWLLTSREPLRVAGECPHEVGPLGLPVGREDAERSEAVQLFVARARSTRPGYALDAEDVEAVVTLVRALDGLPLAIELAAARMGVLGAAALSRRLSQSFEVLGQGPRDAPARQRTLQATISWSWDLLEPWERAALRQCAVFRGGFTLEAAEAVVQLGAFGAPPAVIDALHSLRNKSLLQTTPRAHGEVRFGFFEAIREFAARQLVASGEEPAARARTSASSSRPQKHGRKRPTQACRTWTSVRHRSNSATSTQRGPISTEPSTSSNATPFRTGDCTA